MTKPTKRIAITGGAGQIAYQLLFRIASGEMLGPDQPVALHILEIPEALQALEGVRMELEDCAFPLLRSIRIGVNPLELFDNVDIALLVGAKPRSAGMERKDLLKDNGKIFIEQGKALDAVASRHVRVLVVGNPCNTNCLVAMHNAPNIPRTQFFAMTRLDENRAKSQLALKADVDVDRVTRMAIWGNHSSTLVPDFTHAHITGKPATEVIHDQAWLENAFISTIQKRGAAIIAARGKSSAASAASAVIDTIKSLYHPTKHGDWFSLAVCSDGNPYGVENDLVFSFPCRSNGDGNFMIVNGLEWSPFIRDRIQASETELKEERLVLL